MMNLKDIAENWNVEERDGAMVARPVIKLRVLIACEESQASCKEFRRLGHEAYSCDVLPCSGGHPEWHIQGDAITEAYIGNYNLMIAHPPCTYISKAGARWRYPTAGNLCSNRYSLAMEARAFFMALLNAPIKFKAVENPFPLNVVDLPSCSQTIQPYQYGEPFSKKTLLWLRYLPCLIPTDTVENYTPFVKSNTGGAKRGQIARPNNRTAKETSKTFPGIAKAMAEQWSEYTVEKLSAAIPVFFTSLPPGTYKADELGEVVWQYKFMNHNWAIVSALEMKGYKNDYKKFEMQANEFYNTRLFIHPKASK